MPDGMSLASAGIYTVSETAELIGVSQRRVRGWITGYGSTRMPPLIENELGWVGNRVAFSFTNLMEMKFVAFFENAGIKLGHIRAIMSEVRVALDHRHPFASKTVFRTDRRKIVAEIAKKRTGKLIYDLKTKNYEMRTVMLDTLMDDVHYDADGMARWWYPRQHAAPNVFVHPKIAFGRPVLRDSNIPTRTIAEAVKAEGDVSTVAQWYDLSQKQVREAVKFETILRPAV
jgi:uncharacterized protein (DUF433 family)/DNA-binding transcriptional MerR regulator